GADASGLGLLNLETTLMPEKITKQREIRWNGKPLRGYEIHHGLSRPGEGLKPYLPEDLGWQQGNILGVYLHGLFENSFYRRCFLETLGWSSSSDGEWSERVEASLEKAAWLIADSGWAL
ncbi:MAG: cobyric acid synthase, partial [Spirochaetia bacterium]|nr:cobyric acid synthase [Spirochaetia bacterium]